MGSGSTFLGLAIEPRTIRTMAEPRAIPPEMKNGTATPEAIEWMILATEVFTSGLS